MAILVVCKGCHARFQVSEKFAGKQGPCPKCKTVLTIPRVEDEVKIHVPEEHAGGGKDAAGRPVLKPLERKKEKISPVYLGAVAGVVLLTFVAAFLIGKQANVVLVGVGLAIISPLIAWAGYNFLRNDELEPHEGVSLLVRSLICGGVYAAMWGLYIFIPQEMTQEIWNWVYLPLPFLGVGTLTAYAAFDLDVENAFFHYCFFLVVTILLRLALGWPALVHAT